MAAEEAIQLNDSKEKDSNTESAEIKKRNDGIVEEWNNGWTKIFSFPIRLNHYSNIPAFQSFYVACSAVNVFRSSDGSEGTL
jgi:hypothetical protein